MSDVVWSSEYDRGLSYDLRSFDIDGVPYMKLCFDYSDHLHRSGTDIVVSDGLLLNRAEAIALSIALDSYISKLPEDD